MINADLINVQIHLQAPQVGDFVAFTHDAWRSCPLIGRVLCVDGVSITIRWWIGTYSSTWKPCHKMVQKKKVDWTEKILIVNIVNIFKWKIKEGKPVRVQPSLKDSIKLSYTS